MRQLTRVRSHQSRRQRRWRRFLLAARKQTAGAYAVIVCCAFIGQSRVILSTAGQLNGVLTTAIVRCDVNNSKSRTPNWHFITDLFKRKRCFPSECLRQ